MALQGTSGIAQILSQSFLQSSFRTSLSSFLQAQSSLSRENFSASRFRVEQGLRSRLVNLGALTDVDSLQRARVDVARSSLESVDSTLDELSSLAASAIGADAGTRASLGASASALLSNVSSTLSAALENDSELLIRTGLVHNTAGESVISSVSIDRLNQTLSTPTTIVVNLSNAGERGRLANHILVDSSGAAGVLDDDIEFSITGPDGSATFNFANGTTKQSIIDGINAFSDSTGVFAEDPDGTDIDLVTTAFGSDATVSVTEISDASNQIPNIVATDTGVDATGAVDINGTVINGITFEGRTLNFENYGGASGTIELFRDTDALAEAANPGQVTITVQNGGKALLDDSGNVISRVGFGAFDFGSLGRSAGGLDQIDLVNDAAGALEIIAAAKEDVTTSLLSASGIADGFLASRIETNADQIGNINQSLDEVETFAEAIELFDRVRYESQLNTSLGLLSQLSSLFPLSAFSAL